MQFIQAKKNIIAGLLISGILFCPNVYSSNENKEDIENNFEVKYEIKTTPVKCQYRTGTCWNYSTLSFLESEVIREKGIELDLSEMFVVRKAFKNKAEKFIRYHATTNFGQAGQAHDVINVIKEHGIVPESVLPVDKSNDHYKNHAEMTKSLYGEIYNSLKENRNGLKQLGDELLDSIMDSYLGRLPETFEVNGKSYTAKSYQKEFLGIDLNNYVNITSFKYRPYYHQVELELPDNWDHGKYYNVSLNELIETIDNALENGYSVVWDGDIIDTKYDISKTLYELKDEAGITKISDIIPVTEDRRQELFDNWVTTDDHLMHLVGVAVDKIGRKFYMFKDSAGENHPMIYMSESYVRLNTIAIMVNKNSIPRITYDKLF